MEMGGGCAAAGFDVLANVRRSFDAVGSALGGF